MRKILGRYEVLTPIASGGMATVHLGRAVGVGGFERLVAIKVMHPDVARDTAFVAMFLDEARLAARIRHPNIVGTIDVQESPDGLFIVMEYVEGPSVSSILRELNKQGRRLPLPIALRIMLDALVGLHAAHEQTGASGEPLNIVHRDISPQNILVGVDGHSKITDFGVASAEARLASTEDGSVKGKVAYMSPQQINAERVDRRADVYAAGIVFWEMLTGRRLFNAPNPGAIIYAVMNGARETPREYNMEVPQPIDAVCMRALRSEVNDRYQTTLEFAQALERATFEAGISIASVWDVGSYIKNLGAHSPPPKLDELATPPPALAGLLEKAGPQAASSTPQIPHEIPTTNPGGDSQVSSVSVSRPARPTQSNRTGLMALTAAVTFLGVIIVTVALMRGNGETTEQSGKNAPASTGLPMTAPVSTNSAMVDVTPAASTSANNETEASIPTTNRTKTTAPRTRTTATTKVKTKSNDDWKPAGL